MTANPLRSIWRAMTSMMLVVDVHALGHVLRPDLANDKRSVVLGSVRRSRSCGFTEPLGELLATFTSQPSITPGSIWARRHDVLAESCPAGRGS